MLKPVAAPKDVPLEEQSAAMGVPLDVLRQAYEQQAPIQAPTDTCCIWPDNIIPAVLFEGMLDQWRMGPNGPVGLDLNVLSIVARSRGVSQRHARRAVADLQFMSRTALSELHSED